MTPCLVGTTSTTKDAEAHISEAKAVSTERGVAAKTGAQESLHGSIGHDYAEGHEANAEAAEDGTCIGGPRAGWIWQRRAQIRRPPA
jgi:hypothetical protein